MDDPSFLEVDFGILFHPGTQISCVQGTQIYFIEISRNTEAILNMWDTEILLAFLGKADISHHSGCIFPSRRTFFKMNAKGTGLREVYPENMRQKSLHFLSWKYEVYSSEVFNATCPPTAGWPWCFHTRAVITPQDGIWKKGGHLLTLIIMPTRNM